MRAEDEVTNEPVSEMLLPAMLAHFKVPTVIQCVLRTAHQTHNVATSQLEKRADIVPLLYQQFSKAHIASFASCVADGAVKGDPVCVRIFNGVGRDLAQTLVPLLRKAEASLHKEHGEYAEFGCANLIVVCVRFVVGCRTRCCVCRLCVEQLCAVFRIVLS